MGPQPTQARSGEGSTLPGETSFADPRRETTLSDALATLRKRFWAPLLALLLGAGYGYYKAASQPRLFFSYGRIQVSSGSAGGSRGAASPYASDSSDRLWSEVAILQSDSLMLAVGREMNLANNAAFLGLKGLPPRRTLDDLGLRQQVVGQLQASLRVTLVPRTDIIRIEYSSPDAALSADIVNKTIEQYEKRSYETRFLSTRRVSSWLSNQLGDLKREVETSQEQLMDMQRRLGLIGLDPSRTQTGSAVEDLARASGDARIARIVAEARYRMVAGMDPDTVAGSIETTPGTAAGQLNGLRGQLATARAAYALQLTTLGPNHPTAVALKAQMDELSRAIDAEQKRLLIQSRENFLAARGTEEQTAAALEKQKADAYKLRDQMVQYSLLQRQYESNRTLYEGLLQRLRTADVEAGLDALEIDVVDPAYPAAGPTLQRTSSIVTATAMYFLLAGIFLAFVLESLDSGLRGVAELEAATGLPSLAVVPRLQTRLQTQMRTQMRTRLGPQAGRGSAEPRAGPRVPERKIESLAHPRSQFAESFRTLRTSLLLSAAERQPKLIVLTSATPGEGKTTAATNLACVLAAQDRRVLLIDGDLRRPAVRGRFGLNGSAGLSTLLGGAGTLEEVAQPVPEAGRLHVLPSGPAPPFPTEMLESETMLRLLKRAGELFDYVVVDSPPILAATDAVILARLADAVVLVVRYGKAGRPAIRRARDLLVRSGAPITGTVLNAVPMNSPEYYGYSRKSPSRMDEEARGAPWRWRRDKSSKGGEV